MMRKVSKLKVAKALKKSQSKAYKANQSFHVLYEGTVLHKVKWLPKNSYQSILDQYSKYVKKSIAKHA